MVTDSGDEFDLVGQLHKVVVGAPGKCLRLGCRIFFAGKHDQRYLACGLRGPEKPCQRQPVNPGHNQILQNEGGMDFPGHINGLSGILAIFQSDIRFSRQHAPDRFRHNFLVIHQEHGDGVFGKNRRGFMVMLKVLGWHGLIAPVSLRLPEIQALTVQERW